MPASLLKEMIPLPPLSFQPSPPGNLDGSLDVSLIIPARNSTHSLEQTVREADAFLSTRFLNSYEIILVPNPSPGDTSDLSIQTALELSTRFPAVRVHTHTSPPGKGAAIRTGFSFSRGKWIFLTDADLPYDLNFFETAALKLEEGYGLVTGNRRLPNSHFWVPVSLLPLSYGRHRLGMSFNRLARLLLPITTTDTQAGIKALSRPLALEAFTRQSCPGFLYDLEIFLTAHGGGFRQTDIPVTLFLNSEKSTVRVLRECLLVAHWLIRIKWRNKMGAYGRQTRQTSRSVLARYSGASLSTRLFLLARWCLTPYSRMTAHLPKRGNILDLGCGHGLFALAAVLQNSDRQVFGLDHDVERIRLGSKATDDLPQIHLKQGGFNDFPTTPTPYAGIAMIDVLHYFNSDAQEKTLKQAFEALGTGGILLVREVEPNSGMISSWNRLYEKLATRTSFTQAEEKNLYFRSKQAWCELLEKTGFTVTWKHCSSVVFADILFICTKP
ncbi:MAG: methyltransferase domain-containing protein [Bdellovibrionia bacterium]